MKIFLMWILPLLPITLLIAFDVPPPASYEWTISTLEVIAIEDSATGYSVELQCVGFGTDGKEIGRRMVFFRLSRSQFKAWPPTPDEIVAAVIAYLKEPVDTTVRLVPEPSSRAEEVEAAIQKEAATRSQNVLSALSKAQRTLNLK